MVRPTEMMRVLVRLETRPDGGLRVWSDDVPQLVLSGRTPADVVNDIGPALEVIMSALLGCEVQATPLTPFRGYRSLEEPGVARLSAMPAVGAGFREIEFAAACA